VSELTGIAAGVSVGTAIVSIRDYLSSRFRWSAD